MTFESKSPKAFIAVTLLTVLSIISVITVYAVLLGTYTSTGEVTVLGLGSGNVWYTTDNATWASNLSSNPSDPWFAKLNITSGGYSGPVTLTWQLQTKTASNPDVWGNVTGVSKQTSVLLDRNSDQTIYATDTGAPGDSNYNWGAGTTEAGAYRVAVFVESD